MTESSTTTSSVWQQDEQWVARVIQFSSQYNDSTWSANQVVGPPKVYPRHGDITGAWAQGNRDANEFIIVEFERAVYPEQIDIYETYNPGAVVRVSVRNGKDNEEWEVIWQTAAPHVEGQSRIFSVPCRNFTGRDINQVRLDLNCTGAGNWCEIDCIKLIGHSSLNEISYKELVLNLKHLFLDQSLNDVSFELDNGKVLQSYRNILSSRCIYFQELFEEYPADYAQAIRIHSISSEAFYQLLHFIFTDNVEPVLTYEVCLELMRKADEFHLSAVYQQAFEILKKIINKTNVLKIFTQTGLFADADGGNDSILLPDVIEFCVEFIQKNRRDIYTSDQMQLLTREMLLQLVQLVQ